MPPTPPTPADLQRAVDRANARIRTFWARVGDHRMPTAEEWLLHEELVAAWVTAERARAAREGEDEPAGALVLTA